MKYRKSFLAFEFLALFAVHLARPYAAAPVPERPRFVYASNPNSLRCQFANVSTSLRKNHVGTERAMQ
jgi:hypothetical protein